MHLFLTHLLAQCLFSSAFRIHIIHCITQLSGLTKHKIIIWVRAGFWKIGIYQNGKQLT
jgi:hypothetical protein